MLRTFLRDLLLAEEIDADVDEALGQLVQARSRVGNPREDRASKQPRRAGEERQRRGEEQQENDLAHSGFLTVRPMYHATLITSREEACDR